MNKCRKCGEVLTDKNWYFSFQKNHSYLCIECSSFKSKEYNKREKNSVKKYINIKYSSIKYCRVCDIELVEDNWNSCSKRNNRYICIQCDKKYRKIQTEKYKETKKKYDEKYYVNNKERKDKQNKDWLKTEEGKLSKSTTTHKRRNNLGFIPLNNSIEEPFEAHHLDKTYVLYIPKKLHHSVSHNIYTGYNMDIINEKVIDWYIDYYGLI